ncbi:retrovirus-related pol polyprotein from transposon TNT 1-94 [Tanacetum coccineum]
MDLKWQHSLLSMRAKRYFQRTCKKIFINANDTAGYDKSKVECFNCHKMGHFAKECRAPRNKEGQFRNQDNTRKHGNNEDTSSKAMLAIDGIGFDWSEMAEEQCDDLIVKLNQTEFTAATYKRGLTTVEEQLITYRKNEVLFSEEVEVLKREVACKDYEINVLKSEFEKVKQEKEGIEFKIDKFDNASKDLDKLLGSQITDKSKKGLGYNVVPPPHPLIYNRPKKLDLSYSGLDEFKDPEFKAYGSEGSRIGSNTEIENLVDKKVKIIRSDNGTEFKNKIMDDFCRENDIKREDNSVAGALGGWEGVRAGMSVESMNIRRLSQQPMSYGAKEGVASGGCTSTQQEEISQDCIVMPIWKDASYFDSPSKGVGNGEPKSDIEIQKQLKNVKPASSNDHDSPKDMFKFGASHTLEATHVEFFSDEDEPKVDLGTSLIPIQNFNYADVKSASTPVDLEKHLVKDGDANDVDVHLYRSMIGSLMYLTASRPNIMFACKKQTVVATSTTEAEYVTTASCCRKVLWIQNQLLDYGFTIHGKMETKDTLSSCSNLEEQQMQQIQDKAKKICMVSFQQPHSHLKLLSNNDLNGTRTESGFKCAFATLFGQDVETFIGTMFLNVDQLEKQLDKEEFQEIGSMASFKVLETQFQMFIKSRIYLDDEFVVMTRNYFLQYTQLLIPELRDTLIQHMESVKKSMDERTLHKREYDTRENERQIQSTEGKIDTGNALDASLVNTESSETESKEQDTSNRS